MAGRTFQHSGQSNTEVLSPRDYLQRAQRAPDANFLMLVFRTADNDTGECRGTCEGARVKESLLVVPSLLLPVARQHRERGAAERTPPVFELRSRSRRFQGTPGDLPY